MDTIDTERDMHPINLPIPLTNTDFIREANRHYAIGRKHGTEEATARCLTAVEEEPEDYIPTRAALIARRLTEEEQKDLRLAIRATICHVKRNIVARIKEVEEEA